METHTNNADAERVRRNCISEVVDDRLCKMDQVFYSSRQGSNAALVSAVELEGIDILRDNGAGYREGFHSYDHIRANPSNDILITVPLASRVCQVQSGRVAEFGRGTFSILSTARPFRARISRPDQSNQPLAIMARVAAPLLRRKFPRIGDCYAIPVILRPGAATIMKTLLEVAIEEGRLLKKDQRVYLSHILLDAIAEAALQMPEFKAFNAQTPSVSTRDLYDQAVLYTLNHLDNPDLAASDVARHCNISTRYLRSVFAEFDRQSLVAFIREARLSRCKQDLANPVLRHKPIANIAASWGFHDPAYFSRIYHQRFGRSPRQDRNP